MSKNKKVITRKGKCVMCGFCNLLKGGFWGWNNGCGCCRRRRCFW